MCSLLGEAYDIKGESFLRARREDLIPKEGLLSEGCKFSFHGGGCYFEFENGTIDIDFGPDNRCDGFDSFRLFDFLKTSKSEKYAHLNSEAIIKEELDKLLKEKIIIELKTYPNPHLFFVSSKFP